MDLVEQADRLGLSTAGMTLKKLREVVDAIMADPFDPRVVELSKRPDTTDQGRPTIDKTDQGEQRVIPGTERISDKEFAERRMQGKLRPKAPQKEADEGLFDTGARKQDTLFSFEEARAAPPGEAFVGFIKDQATAATGTVSRETPITRESVLAPLLKALGQRIFQGQEHFKARKAGGFFRPHIREVRVRNRGDLEVTAHELAHLLDDRDPEIRQQWFPATKANKTIRDELRGVSYDKKKLFEGFAEFVRHWMSGTVDEASGRPFVEVAAPNFLRWFEGFLDGNRHGPAFRRAQQQMQAWFDQTALDRARSKIGQNENINQITEARFRERFRAGALDDLFGVLNAEQTLTGEYNGPWYTKARLTRGASGIVQGAVEFGAPVWSEGQVIFVDASGAPIFSVENGRVVRNAKAQPWGLEQALSLVADDLESFGQYAIGKRADFLRRQGREKLFSKAEIDAMLALETPSRAKAFENWNRFNKQLLDFAQQSGVIDPAGRAKWETNVYLPFWRVTSASAGFLSTQRAGIPGFTGVIKRLKGGTGNVGDPIENMHRNTRMLIESAIFNNARATLVEGIMKVQGTSPESPGGARFLAKIPRDSKLVRARTQSIRDGITDAFQKAQAERARRAIQKGDESPLEIGERLNARAGHFSETLDDIFAELPMGAIQVWEDNQPPQGPNVIAIMKGGKPQFFEVADPLLFNAFTSMPRAVRASGVLRFFKFFRRLGQRTITVSIDFAVRNIARDNIMATVMSESGFRPFIDAAKGMKSRLARDPNYQAWLANGGGLASFWSSERAFESRLRGHYESHGIAYNLVINGPKKFGFFLDAILDSFETGTRLGEFQRALKKGKTLQEAAFQSREISTDFAMRGDPRVDILVRGDAATLAALYDTVLFLKAGVVGVDRVYRGFTKQQNRGKVAVYTGTIALASVFLYALNRGNPLYDDLEDLDKDFELGADGVKILSNFHGFLPDNPGFMPVYEMCRKYNKPVIIDGSFWYFKKFLPNKESKSRQKEAQTIKGYTKTLATVLAEFPTIAFSLAHTGTAAVISDYDEIYKVMSDHSNVTCDTAASRGYSAEWFQDLVQSVGAHKVMYGTDWPYWLDEGLDSYRKGRRRWTMITDDCPKLTEHEKKLILAGNADRFIKTRVALDDNEEIKKEVVK
ncbi:MAG: amidohydrolase family protein [Proteobacteria bacterium]|nr:amidohydrolase family protein [Pseudomonadota bacterium]